MKYRLFVEDMGDPGDSLFSGVEDVEADSPRKAILKYTGTGSTNWIDGRRYIALPHSRKDLWPHSRSGAVPPEALEYR